jgi:ribosome-binding protein aMBF1 (putative translation factor)
VSSQANEVCEKKGRNKINSEHLFEALTELGFSAYIEDMKNIGEEATSGRKQRTKKSKAKVTGKTEEQLAREQAEKLAQARSRTGLSASSLADAPKEEEQDEDEDDDEDLLDDDE